MIDPFTLSTGVSGLLSLTSEIIKLVKGYSDAVQSASQEVQDLALQCRALAEVLEKLQNLLRSDALDDIAFEPDSGPQLVLKSARNDWKLSARNWAS